MATKPTNLARWAETAGGTPASGITEPSSGKKDTGWVPAEEPPAQTFNWWQWQIYQWIKYLSDGALTGNHSIQKSAVGDSSTLVVKDPGGNNRFLVDHLGLPGGQITVWEEDWRGTGTTAPNGWTFTPSGGAAATMSDPSTVLPFRRLVLTTAASSGAVEAKTNSLFSCDTNTAVVYEQIIRTGAAIDSGTSIFLMIGLVLGGVEARFLLNPDTNANIVTDIGGSQTASSVVIAVDTTYRLRIEVLGDAMHAGSNSLVRFFVNGVMIREGTNASIAGALGRYESDFDNGAGSTVYTVHTGPVRITWAQVASGDAL